MNWIDLHLHTAYSREADNFLPERLASIAEAKVKRPGLKVAGVVDHDTINHWEPMYRAQQKFAPGQLPIILPGVEISSCFTFLGKVIQTHVLGFFPKLIRYDREKLVRVDKIFRQPLTDILNGRWAKNVEIRIQYLLKNNLLPAGYDVQNMIARVKAKNQHDLDFVSQESPKDGDVINLPLTTSHLFVLEVMLEDGLIESIEEGMLYLDRHYEDKVAKLAKILARREQISDEQAYAKARVLQGSCHGSYGDDWFKLSTQDALSLIRLAGGVAILAHPMVSFKKFPGGITAFFEFCRQELIIAGLMGLEAYYPRQDEYQPAIIEFCRQNGLIITGGSDDHQDGRNHIGEVICPYENVEQMISAHL